MTSGGGVPDLPSVLAAAVEGIGGEPRAGRQGNDVELAGNVGPRPPAARCAKPGLVGAVEVVRDRSGRHDRRFFRQIGGHAARVAKIRERLATIPGLSVVGSAYDGVGIPDCVRQAREIARTDRKSVV